MPDDAKICGEFYELYVKWRYTQMNTEELWIAFAESVKNFAVLNSWETNPLTKRLAYALLDIFDDLYGGGKRPPMPDYFGRSDL